MGLIQGLAGGGFGALRTGAYKLHYDLHRSTGILLLPVLCVLALTGIYLNLPEVVKPVVGWFSPLTANAPVSGVGKVEPGQAIVSPEQAVATALAQLPRGRVTSLARDFAKGLYAVRLALPTDVSPSGNNTVYVRMSDGALHLSRTVVDRTAADTYLAWQLPLHAGYAFGAAGQLLVSIAGMGTVLMGITGFKVWRRKSKGRKRR